MNRFKFYVNAITQLLFTDQNIDFCRVYQAQAASFTIDQVNKPSILDYFLIDKNEPQLFSEALGWMIGDSWDTQDFNTADVNSILSKINAEFYADTTITDTCAGINVYAKKSLVELIVKY